MVRERASTSAAAPTRLAAAEAVAARVATAPAPGQADLPAANAAAMVKRNGTDPLRAQRPALRFGDRVWTHRDVLGEAVRFAACLEDRLDPARPPHVAVLLDNTPDYVFTLYGAALIGATLVGLNHTRRGEHLARDITYTDAQLVITEPRHAGLLEPIAGSLDLPGGLLLSTAFADEDDPRHPPLPGAGLLEDALDAATPTGTSPEAAAAAMPEPGVETLWALIFTSGTSAAPKAVRCTQRRLLTTGARLAYLLGVGEDDVGYVSMPLFHSNALMVGLAPAFVTGASFGLARRFSASRFLDDVRRYGATWFNYTGKPLAYLLATPERPDDADNPLVVAYGNEGSPAVVEAVSARFDVAIIDVFGATEGAIALDRAEGTPRGSVGRLKPGVAVVDPEGNDVPRARFDAEGRLLDAEACVGELVHKEGVGPFEGYYRNEEAMAKTTRKGWYWSGDLAYVDEDGWVYFAGRSSDWLRVDGENFPAGPIETIIARHPDVMFAAVYGVPDVDAGDQVMVSMVLHEGAVFDPGAFADWVDAQPDLSPKWRPRYVRVSPQLPVTATNKILVRSLVHQKFRADRTGGDPVWTRGRGAASFTPFDAKAEDELRQAFEAAGRAAAWDL
ncbi:MAG TPA: AMP-binding protein [Acidimicrobiales bacterium]|nr:AMP-binding protein [Acidimicrobiales bacterium]